MAAFLVIRVRETRREQLEDFYDLWNTLQLKLESDNSISQSYLAQTEAGRRVIIHIEENGAALRYNGSWTPRTPREKLIGQVLTMAQAEGVFTTMHPISSLPLSSVPFSRSRGMKARITARGYWS